MTYHEYFADKIRKQLKEKRTTFTELKMIDGLCF